MKLSLSVPCLFGVFLLSAPVSRSDTWTTNGVTYEYYVSNGKATIGNNYAPAIPTSTSGALDIPSTLGGYPVTSIGWNAFYGCSHLTSVSIPIGIISIGDSAFYDCSAMTSVSIPDSVTSIGDETFRICSSMTAVTIPDSITSIGSAAFADCSSLISLNVDTANTNYISLNGILYTRDLKTLVACPGAKTSVILPSTVTTIGDSAFSGCSSLPSVTISTYVTSIGNSAFVSCTNLASIIIPDGVISIGGNAFHDCSRLASIIIPRGVTAIDGWTFSNCTNLTSVTIPDGVTSIGTYAFAYCLALNSVTISASVILIDKNAFCNCPQLNKIEVNNDNTRYTSLHGILYTKDMKTLVAYPSAPPSLTIPAVITSIGQSAFEGCLRLTSVTIPDSVTSIGKDAFFYCPALATVNLPNSVVSIDDGAFADCYALTSIIIPSSVISIGNNGSIIGGILMIDGAFSGCTNLASVTIHNGVTSIGVDAFRGCSSLTSIVIPDSVTSIGMDAFAHCSCLSSIIIPNGVTTIGGSAFYECTNLASVIIPCSVTNINGDTFYGCSALKSVYYLGNAPVAYGANYDLTQNLLISYVTIGSMGWDGNPGSTNIPSLWQDRPIAVMPMLTNLTFSLGATIKGDAKAISYSTNILALSGETMGDNTMCGIKLITSGNGRLVFRWNVSSEEDCDYACCRLDDQIINRRSGKSLNWEYVTNTVTDSYAHTWSLTYEKDSDSSDEIDTAWFADIQWQPIHTVTVSGGIGSASYYIGDTVTIAANDRMPDWCFVRWDGGTNLLSNSSTLTNTFMMPDRDIVLAAIYKTRIYNVSVTNGTGSASHHVGDRVQVQANQSIGRGSAFICWTGDTNLLANATSSLTTFTMPWHNVTLEAIYSIPSETIATLNQLESSFCLPSESVSANGTLAALSFATNTLALSGIVMGNAATSGVTLTTSGNGTLVFRWNVSSEKTDILSYSLDGTVLATRSGKANDWQWVTNAVTDGAAHVWSFAYTKDADSKAGADTAWIADISWTPDAPARTATVLSPVPVEYTWLTKYGLTDGDDYEAAATNRCANGLPAWQNYVAGLVPTNPLAAFRAEIAISNGVRYISWTPDLTNGVGRVYTIYGATNLTDRCWLTPTNDACRFFHVKVDLMKP